MENMHTPQTKPTEPFGGIFDTMVLGTWKTGIRLPKRIEYNMSGGWLEPLPYRNKDKT